MATISKQLSGGSSAPTLKLTVEAQAYNVVENTTPVKYTFTIERPSSVSSTALKKYTLKIGSKTITGSASIGGSGTKTIETGTVTITHNSDGKKSIDYSFSMSVDLTWSGTYNGTVSQSGSTALPDIPRVTQPSVADDAVIIGDTVKISTPRASDSFTHTLKLRIDDYATTIMTGVTTSYMWTVPESIANQIPNNVSYKAVIWCDTILNGKVIGSKSCDIILKVPTTAQPTIGEITVSEAVEAITIGEYVQGMSALAVSIPASGVYGSTIIDVTSKIDGVTYKGSQFTTDTLLTSGDLVLSVTAKDSRGRSVSKTKAITVRAYQPPQITVFKAVRCTSDGTESDSGECAKITYKYAISDINQKNAKSAMIDYQNGDTFTQLKAVNTYTGDETFITDALFTSDSAFLIRLTVSDSFFELPVTGTLPTDIVPFDVLSSGDGAAFGKVAETADLLDIAWGLKAKSIRSNSMTDTEYALAPTADATRYLGTSTLRWRAVYASNGTIQTSDRRLKRDIEPLGDRYINLFRALQPVTYKRTDGDRRHIGFIAQEVENAMIESGIDVMDLGALCVDNTDNGSIYGLRYEEFVALNTLMIQKLLKTVEDQQMIIDGLRKAIERN